MGGVGLQRATAWPPGPEAPERPARGIEEQTVLEPASRAASPVERSAVLEKLLFDDMGTGAPAAPVPADVEPEQGSTGDEAVRHFYGPKLGLDGHCGLRPSLPKPPPFQANPHSGANDDAEGSAEPPPSRFRAAPELLGIILAVGLIATVLLSRPWA